jgi:hypothetical protein
VQSHRPTLSMHSVDNARIGVPASRRPQCNNTNLPTLASLCVSVSRRVPWLIRCKSLRRSGCRSPRPGPSHAKPNHGVPQRCSAANIPSPHIRHNERPVGWSRCSPSAVANAATKTTSAETRTPTTCNVVHLTLTRLRARLTAS